MRLPAPTLDDATDWVRRHLGHLSCDEVVASGRFTGGQRAADAALDGFDVRGYASQRNEVWPRAARGASALSPYIRHGLLTLRRVWDSVEGGPSNDVERFRNELDWQEYARHLYSRLGHRTGNWVRYRVEPTGPRHPEPWRRDMACIDLALAELETDGWLVNQTRMWLASQWTVRAGADWRTGEDVFFRHLLDGSRAANRLGWLWTIGGATGSSYGFSRWQVERRAPGLCDGCGLSERCPIQDWPADPATHRVPGAGVLTADPDPEATSGPASPRVTGVPGAVWLTAESLGDRDPALAANPDLPVVFVFDEPLLGRLRLSSKRLVFLSECLADLSQRREVEIFLADPVEVLTHRSLAATYTPVPGWRRLRGDLDLAEIHPWPWLHTPHGGSVASFSQWVKR